MDQEWDLSIQMTDRYTLDPLGGMSLMWTSHLLIQPLYLQLHTYKDLSQDLVPNNLTIRYFRFLKLFLTYMRIRCCLNQMYLLLLGMMDQAWMRGTSIGACPCMRW